MSTPGPVPVVIDLSSSDDEDHTDKSQVSQDRRTLPSPQSSRLCPTPQQSVQRRAGTTTTVSATAISAKQPQSKGSTTGPASQKPADPPKTKAAVAAPAVTKRQGTEKAFRVSAKSVDHLETAPAAMTTSTASGIVRSQAADPVTQKSAQPATATLVAKSTAIGKSVSRPVAVKSADQRQLPAVPATVTASTATNTVKDGSRITTQHVIEVTPLAPAPLEKSVATDENEIQEASPTPISLPEVPADWDPNKRRPYQCKFCNGKFLSPILLRAHIQAHKDALNSASFPLPQHECHICNRVFLYQTSRACHILLKHSTQFVPPPVLLTNEGDDIRTAPAENKSPKKKPAVHGTSKRPEPADTTDNKPPTGSMPSAKKVKAPVSTRNQTEERDGAMSLLQKGPANESASSGRINPPLVSQKNRRSARVGKDFKRQEQSPSECASCKQLFRDSVNHQFHLPCFKSTPFSTDSGFKCPACNTNIIYGSLNDLKVHASAVHRVPQFSCNYCKTHTYKVWEMEIHIARDHSEKLV